jgi:hypothetical protein
VQGDLPLLNIQLRAGDQPVPRTVLWPHGHLRRLDKLEQPLGPNGHGRPSGEHTGVYVNPRRLPLLLDGARRRRERLGQEAHSARQPHRVVRPLGPHHRVSRQLSVQEPEVEYVGRVVSLDVQLSAGDDVSRRRAAGAAPARVVLHRHRADMGEHSPLDRLEVPLVGDRLRSAPYRLLG